MAITIIGQRERRIDRGWRVTGTAKFTTTDLTGLLPISNKINLITSLETPEIIPSSAPGIGRSFVVNVPIGALSASADEHVTFVSPIAGTVTAVTVQAKEGIAAADTNYFAFGLLNKTGTLTPVDIATATNTTQATGGVALVAYTPLALTVNPTGSAVVVAAGDMFEFNVVHHGTPGTAQTEASVTATITPTATSATDERLYWSASGIIQTTGGITLTGMLKPTFSTSVTPNAKAITVTRSGSTITSGLYFSFAYEGE